MGYPSVYRPTYTGPPVVLPTFPPGRSVLSRLSWLGIARETIPGVPVLPVAAVPVSTDGYEPEDTPQFLLDKGIRASMGSIAGAVPGVRGSALAFSGPLHTGSPGYWFDNLFGDTSTVSNGSLGAAQPLAAPVNAGATQITVGTSLGAVIVGSVIQISDGAASETVTATQYSTGLVVNCTGTPLRFGHGVTATAALQTAAAGYTHTFATLNAGTGQGPTHTLTDTTGLTAGTGARCYPGAVVTQIDLAGDPGQGWVTGKITGMAWLSQPSAAIVTFPQGTYIAPWAGWQSVVNVNGNLAYAGPWAVSLKRAVVVYRNAQNPQNPGWIVRGGLEVTGTLGYPDPSDETPLENMLTGGLMPVQISLSNGLSGASALGMTITSSAAQFLKSKPDRTRVALGYQNAYQATDNSNDTGGTGGIGPATVALTNGVANY